MTTPDGRNHAGFGSRDLLVFLAKVAVSVGLIWFLMSKLSFADVRQAMEAPRWGWLGAALAVYALSAFGGARQWAWILAAAGITSATREIQRLYFIGLFFNNFLPANIGGDAYKIVDLGRREHRALGVFCATLLDRLVGLGALAILAVLVLAGATVAGIPLPPSALLMLPVVGLLFGVLASLLSQRLGSRLPGLVRRLGWLRMGDKLAEITAEFAHYRKRVRWLSGIFLFSVGIQFLRMATHLLVALGLGFSLTGPQAVQLLVLIPMLAVSLTLPITINGIGLRESVSASLLTWAGLTAGEAVAMELAAYMVQVIFSLQGGILLWLGSWGSINPLEAGTSLSIGCCCHSVVLFWSLLISARVPLGSFLCAAKPLEGDALIEKWFRRPQWVIAAGVFALTLAVYIATMNPTTPFWDSGEFITTSHIVGVPHQPGTPLYVLVGRVFDIIFGSADLAEASFRTAWAVNFMSAFFSALAVMFTYLLIWELSRRADPDAGWLAHVGGVVGAFFLAFSQTFWNSAIEAEVYGLSAFMLAILSWLAVRWYDNRENEGSHNLLLLMIYLLGLGVGFHLGSLLVYPGIFLIVMLAAKRRLPFFDLCLISVGLAIFLFSTISKNNMAVVGILAAYLVVVMVRSFQGRHFALLGSALFFVGLTVHVMMMIRAGATPPPFINQTQPDNFATLLEVIRREQYPPMNPFERRADIGWQFGYYYQFLFKQFYFMGPGFGTLTAVTTVLGPIFLALVGLFQGLRRLFPLILLPLVNYLINGEILTLYLNFTANEVRDRDYFYFAAFMFFAVFIGMGASALLRYAAGGEGESAEQAEKGGRDWRSGIPRVKVGPAPMIAAVVLVIISLMPLTPGHTKFFEHDNSENRIAYEYAWNILAGLDQDAIIFTNGDNDTFPIWYLQEVEIFRRDVTVVNLSLVNLAWYIKQLKYNPVKPLDLTRTDKEIDALRHRIYEDPNTGERTVLMIKDYVVHDIITTNHARQKRPVFFAVTIPTDNMSRYVPNLQMEGMAYRLIDTASPDEMPVTDPRRVMENMLGVYRVGALMDGDTPQRRRTYADMAGLADEAGDLQLGRQGRPLDLSQLDELATMYGEPRNDVYRNTNARHLLGNYPAALNRAGYEYFITASSVGASDTLLYRENLENAMLAFRTSLQVAPFNDLALEYYPLLLIQAYRDEDARVFLESMSGNVSSETEERILFNTMKALVQGGEGDLALSWISDRLANHPDREFFYQLQFHIHQALGQREAAQAVMEAFETRTGKRPAEMERALEEMNRRALDREQQRIEDAVGGGDGQ